MRHALALASAALLAAAVAGQDDSPTGRTLRCCYLLEEPYVVRDPRARASGNVSGLAITYLKKLEENLDFTCDLSQYEATEPDFVGFTGFVRAMKACATPDGDSSACPCDLGVGAWAVSSERFAQVDFISSFSAESFRVATRTDSVRDSAASSLFFLQAFTTPVWCAIASLVVLHMFVTMFDKNFFPRVDSRSSWLNNSDLSWWQRTRMRLLKSTLPYRLRMSFFNTSVHFIGQYVQADSHKTGTKTKLMNIMGLMFGVFLLTIFQASVTVQVLITVPMSDFGTIDDIKSCRISADRLCFTANGASANFFNVAIEPSSCVADSDKKPVVVSSFDDGFKSVMEGKCDFYYTLQGQILSQTQGRWCKKLTAIGKPFFETAVSFVLPKNSNLTTSFSRETLLFREEDVLESSQEFAERQICPDVTDATLDWEKVKIFFYMSWAALAAMLVFMIVDTGPPFSSGIKNDGIDTRDNVQDQSSDVATGQDVSAPDSLRSLDS